MNQNIYIRKKIKELEANANFNLDDHYLECKNNLEMIYQEKTNSNLEKQHALQNQVPTLLISQNEITDKKKINDQLHHFYKTLVTETLKI